jgi:hypothetical protein
MQVFTSLVVELAIEIEGFLGFPFWVENFASQVVLGYGPIPWCPWSWFLRIFFQEL